MRTRWALAFLLAAGCGTEAPPSASTAAPDVAPTWLPALAGGAHLEVEVRERLARQGANVGVLFRLTNHGDVPLLVDLRHIDRVIRPGVPSELHLPLSDDQLAELSEVSALAQIGPSASITYAVPYSEPGCESQRPVALGGALTALDDGRTIEIVADGAEVTLSCDPPTPAPDGTTWVTAAGGLSAAGRDPADFGVGLDPLLRAAAVTGSADVALLPLAYDARSIERWRYDACVSVDRCPPREVEQPPGSLRAPAVGMSAAGVQAFCESRGLRALSAEETARIGDPARPLVTPGTPDVVTSGLRCGRSVDETPPAP